MALKVDISCVSHGWPRLESIADRMVALREMHQSEQQAGNRPLLATICRRWTFFHEGVARIGTPQAQAQAQHTLVALRRPSTLPSCMTS